ncbi:MAG: hypothetical protein AB7O68_19945 [Pirellulales bacterium]
MPSTLVHLRQPRWQRRTRIKFDGPGPHWHESMTGISFGGPNAKVTLETTWPHGDFIPSGGPSESAQDSGYYYGCGLSARTGLVDPTPILRGQYGIRTPTPPSDKQASLRIGLPGPATKLQRLLAHVSYDPAAYGELSGAITPGTEPFPALFVCRLMNSTATVASLEPRWFITSLFDEPTAIGEVPDHNPGTTFESIELNGQPGCWVEYLSCAVYLDGVWQTRSQPMADFVVDGDWHSFGAPPELLERVS